MENSNHLKNIVDDAASITAVVKAAMSQTDNPRLKELLDALVDHGHAFLSR